MVRIELGKITEFGDGYTRDFRIKDFNDSVYEKMLFASNREELEVIDHENMPEVKDFSF